MSNLSKSVLDKIQKGEVKLKPRWQFVLVHVVLWGAVVFSIILGSLATGVVLREVIYTNWDFVPHLGKGPVKGFLFLIPYFWIGTLILVVCASSWLLSKTKKGYRFKPWMFVLSTVLISVLIGTGMFFSRLSDRFDDAVCDHLQPCSMLKKHREMMWLAPEHGVLAGRILEIKGKELWVVNDMTGKKWNVLVGECGFKPRIDLPIVAHGKKLGENKFKAEKIRIRKAAQRHLFKPLDGSGRSVIDKKNLKK